MQWSREVASGSICSGDTLERGNGESGGVLPSLSAVLRISTAELIISALLLLK